MMTKSCIDIEGTTLQYCGMGCFVCIHDYTRREWCSCFSFASSRFGYVFTMCRHKCMRKQYCWLGFKQTRKISRIFSANIQFMASILIPSTLLYSIHDRHLLAQMFCICGIGQQASSAHGIKADCYIKYYTGVDGVFNVIDFLIKLWWRMIK